MFCKIYYSTRQNKSLEHFKQFLEIRIFNKKLTGVYLWKMMKILFFLKISLENIFAKLITLLIKIRLSEQF